MPMNLVILVLDGLFIHGTFLSHDGQILLQLHDLHVAAFVCMLEFLEPLGLFELFLLVIVELFF
jgi:hypothetical protein